MPRNRATLPLDGLLSAGESFSCALQPGAVFASGFCMIYMIGTMFWSYKAKLVVSRRDGNIMRFMRIMHRRCCYPVTPAVSLALNQKSRLTHKPLFVAGKQKGQPPPIRPL